jgi:uncharacterized protein
VIRVSEYAAFEAPDPVYWVPHGYVVVGVNNRAPADSEGDRFAHLLPQMAEDFHDAVGARSRTGPTATSARTASPISP